jgi:hypothetical protein
MRGRLEDGRKSQQKSEENGVQSPKLEISEYGLLITERTDPELEITDYGVLITEHTPCPCPLNSKFRLLSTDFRVLITEYTPPCPQ